MITNTRFKLFSNNSIFKENLIRNIHKEEYISSTKMM